MGSHFGFAGIDGETGLKKAKGGRLPTAIIRGEKTVAWTGRVRSGLGRPYFKGRAIKIFRRIRDMREDWN